MDYRKALKNTSLFVDLAMAVRTNMRFTDLSHILLQFYLFVPVDNRNNISGD